MNYTLKTLRAVTASAAFVLGTTASAQDLPRSATIGTNPQGSVYYAVGSGVAQLLSEELNTNVRVRPFSGTTQFLPLVNDGELEMGINAAVDLRSAYEGREPWPLLDDLRALTPLLRLEVSMMVPDESDIQSVADLEGRRVTGNYTAHQTSLDATAAILAGAGLTWDDVEVVPVSGHIEGIRAVAEGRADAALASFNPAVREADATLDGGVRFIPVETSEQAQAAIAEYMPGATTSTMPADGYVGFFDDTAVLGWAALLTTGASSSGELAYQVTKTIHENPEAMQAIHARISDFSADQMAVEDIAIPYHPDAVRYFDEQGLWSDALQAHQDELLALQQDG